MTIPSHSGHIDVAAVDLLRDSDTVLLDVRDDDEWAAGHIDGSVHAPLSVLDISRVPAAPVVVVCRSGRRAERAAEMLTSATHPFPVRVLDGGVLAWSRSGRSLLGSDGEPGLVL